jgi:hypothetical protein
MENARAENGLRPSRTLGPVIGGRQRVEVDLARTIIEGSEEMRTEGV